MLVYQYDSSVWLCYAKYIVKIHFKYQKFSIILINKCKRTARIKGIKYGDLIKDRFKWVMFSGMTYMTTGASNLNFKIIKHSSYNGANKICMTIISQTDVNNQQNEFIQTINIFFKRKDV